MRPRRIPPPWSIEELTSARVVWQLGSRLQMQPATMDPLRFSLRLKPRQVLKAIIARQAAHQLAPPPIIENAAEILARNASHSGKVALSNLLVNHNAAGSDIPTEVFREFEQCPRDPTFEREETSRSDRFICFIGGS